MNIEHAPVHLEVVAEMLDAETGKVCSANAFSTAHAECRIVSYHGTVSLKSANSTTMTLVVSPQPADFQQISIYAEGALVEWLFYKDFRLTHTKLDYVRRAAFERLLGRATAFPL